MKTLFCSLRGSLALVVTLVVVAGCGGGSGGSGTPETKDSGRDTGMGAVDSSGPSDTGSPNDVTVPQDSGISQDSGVDATIDSPAPEDTSIADTSVADSGSVDSTVADTFVEDSMAAADTNTAADTSVADTSVADTSVADTSVADTNVADTNVADSETMETSLADSGQMEAAIGDSSAADTAVEEAEAASPEAGDATVSDGTSATYTIGGTVSGLAGGGSFAIEDNAGDEAFISTNGSFTFPTALPSGSTYAVTVAANPMAPVSETCTVMNGSGTVSGANVTSVEITCVVNGYTLGGTVYGLTAGTTLQLQNGSNAAIVSGNGNPSQTFQFSTLVPPDGSYDVTVPTQPSGQLCYSSNPSGTGTNANVTSIIFKCRTGLVAYYPFDEGSGTTMLDVTGNGNNGVHNATYVAGATATTGKALAFNGTTGGTVDGNAAFTWGANNADYTVDYWVLTNVVQTDGNWTTILHKSDPSGGNCCSDWQRSPAEWFYPNSLQMHCPMSTAGNGNNAAVPCSATPVTMSTWTHFATVHSSAMDAEVVYVNGNLVNTITLNDTSVGGTGMMFFAAGPGGYDNLNGDLDEVRIYSRALSQTEVQADMQ